ncbi:ATP-grasp domain-containing protein [Haoranjiania flava]|uniref:ATP-grasp domain-containing protein n=1 Tax=Haoranjiania flava TaxID=1856322 RepID=A0AAE3IQM0_9BACT|nr:ATP-grasp domain-containing protein [Haoranjiania flava]MCU7694606.1 ATP-grasp domain-containing protein [Haoranjiania flava]
MNRKTILIFGLGALQKSIIERCKIKGLKTIGIDLNSEAECRDFVDIFEVVEASDFEKTYAIAKRYNVTGLITAATDKPLVMMARVADELGLPFISIQTAEWSTDKLLMKQKFQQHQIPCANGFVIGSTRDLNDSILYPVIMKPRDNSGSRGVMFCNNYTELTEAIEEVFKCTKKANVLVEEYLDGREFSVEAVHYQNNSHILQITQKTTTEFPYNVELAHIQPAEITNEEMQQIQRIIERVAIALKFENCTSHTELKIASGKIKIIETSPRLGGDFISSKLVPLSTGINMEDILIDICTGSVLDSTRFYPLYQKSSGIIYFELPEGFITAISGIEQLNDIEGIVSWSFALSIGDKVPKITSSLNRYGHAIFQTDNKEHLMKCFKQVENILQNTISIQL